MSTPAPVVSKRLAVLFWLALVGVIVMVGLALFPLGWPVLAPYGLVVLVGLVVIVRRAATLRPKPTGQSCTCCTSTVYDPVEVI